MNRKTKAKLQANFDQNTEVMPVVASIQQQRFIWCFIGVVGALTGLSSVAAAPFFGAPLLVAGVALAGTTALRGRLTERRQKNGTLRDDNRVLINLSKPGYLKKTELMGKLINH